MLTRPLAIVAVAAVSLAGAGQADATGPHPERSVVAIESHGCSLVASHAVGWLASPGLVVTVAHAVRGATEVAAGEAVARVVALDLRTDVAVLAVSTSGTPLGLGTSTSAARVWVGHIVDGRSVVTAASTGAIVDASIDEPADNTTYTRQARVLSFDAVPGDSGAPVVDGEGAVIGMVFATARAEAHLSYAVSASEIAGVLKSVAPGSPSVDRGRCA